MKFNIHKLILALFVIFISLCPFSIYAEYSNDIFLKYKEYDFELFGFNTYDTSSESVYLLDRVSLTSGSNEFSGNNYHVVGNGLPSGTSHGEATGKYTSFAFDGDIYTYQGTYRGGPEYSPEPVKATITFDNPVNISGIYFLNSNVNITVEFEFSANGQSYRTGGIRGGEKTILFDSVIENVTECSYSGVNFDYDWSQLYEFNLIGENVPQYTLDLNVDPLGTGSVSGAGTYIANSDVDIYASPNEGYLFKYWSDGVTDNPRTITINDDTELTAIFEKCIVAPNLQLPNVTLPQQTINTEQNTYLNTNSSNAVKGGSINLFQIDYYNIYTVVQTAESDQFFDSRNDNYYVYQESSDGVGHYIFAVYDYSKLYVFAPNMSVSSSGFTLTYSQAHNIKYSYASSNGLIQRDVSKFEFEYVDNTLVEYFGYNKLPFNNSNDNMNKLEWIGTKTKMLNGQASSMSASLSLNTGTIMTNLNFVITDTTNSYENAQMMNNQTIINNNMNQNFNQLENTIFDGDTQTQQVVQNNNNQNVELDTTIAEYDQLEQGFKDDMDQSLNDIDMNFDLGNITDFTNTALFVRTQFGNLVNDNPIGQLLGFSLMVGLSLLIIGKRL